MEQEPKIGDWCEFWNEGSRVLGHLREFNPIYGFPWVDENGFYWSKCRVVTPGTPKHNPYREALELVKHKLEQYLEGQYPDGASLRRTLQHVNEVLGTC